MINRKLSKIELEEIERIKLERIEIIKQFMAETNLEDLSAKYITGIYSSVRHAQERIFDRTKA